MQPVTHVTWKGQLYPVRWRLRPDGDGYLVDNWFSNMTLCARPISWMGRPFRSVEHGYQAAKFQDPQKIRRLQGCSYPQKAKSLARKWKKETPDWETKRVLVMWKLCVQKWTQQMHQEQLLRHHGEIVEFLNWSDDFWGVVITPDGKVLGGRDQLGRIITEIKTQMTLSPDQDPIWQERILVTDAPKNEPDQMAFL